jgi:SAM-dependent methyltransferase
VPALSADPLILDLGCGPGATAILLARETGGHVVGLDLHRPFLDAVRQRAGEANLQSRVAAVHGSMDSAPFAPGAFDLVWSEGALYSVGLARGLEICREALKPHGHLAFTEAVWLETEPPEEARRWWEGEYPGIGTIDANLELIESAGFSTLEHFTLPESAWWAYYDPIEARLDDLRQRHNGEPVALDVLAEAQAEVDMYRRFGQSYGYEFFVCRRRFSS